MDSSYVNLQERLEYVSKQTLPESLTQLSHRQESLDKVVQYLETNYVNAQRNGDNKDDIMKESQEYVTNALVNVMKDIEYAACSLDQLVSMQTLSVNSLASDIQTIQSKLYGMKEQYLLTSLDEMKASNNSITISDSPPAVRDVTPSLLFTNSTTKQQSVTSEEPSAPPPASTDDGSSSVSELSHGEYSDNNSSSGNVRVNLKKRKSIEERLINLQSITTSDTSQK